MKRIFVSSTFIDMNAERDAIQQVVAPALNHLAKKYGESVSFCDLRWGVNTSELDSEEGSKKVLSVCLDEIDDCAPYMVVLLGERYGWIPSQELISHAANTKSGFNLDELEKSVTALEIEYGSLQNEQQLRHTLFYFREILGDAPAYYRAEDDYHAQKATSLKNRIAALAKDQLRHYTLQWDASTSSLHGIEEFSQQVIHDIHALMEEDWKEYASVSPYERDARWQKNLMHQNIKPYPDGFPWLEDHVRNNTEFLRITGFRTQGKTSYICSVAGELESQGWNILPIFCRQTATCNTVADVQRYIIYHLEKLLHQTPGDTFSTYGEDTSRLQKRMTELCSLYAESGNAPLLIFMDDMDLLATGTSEELYRLILPNPVPRVQIMATMLDSATLPIGKSIESYANRDPRSVIDFNLKHLRRELSEDVIAAIINKPASKIATYTGLLVHRLCMLDIDDYEQIRSSGGDMASIAAHQKSIIDECENDFELGAQILRKAAEQFKNPHLYSAMKYLAASLYGLREEDLAALLRRDEKPWNTLDFRRYVLYFSQYFGTRDNGIIYCKNAFLLQGVSQPYEEYREYQQKLYAYLKTLAPEDPVCLNEIAYQCMQANDSEYLLEYIAQIQNNPKSQQLLAVELAKASRSDNCHFAQNLYYTVGDVANQHPSVLITFVNSRLKDMFPNQNRQDESLRRSFAFMNAHLAECLAQREPSVLHLKNHIQSSLLAGEIYLEIGEPHERKRADIFYRNAKDTLALYLQKETCHGDIYDHLRFVYRTRLQLGRYDGSRDFEAALKSFEECLTLRQQLILEKPALAHDPELAYLDIEIGDLYRYQKKHEESFSYYSKVLEVYKNLLKENPDNETLLNYQMLVRERLYLYYNATASVSNPFNFEQNTALAENNHKQIALDYLDKVFSYTQAQYHRFPSVYWKKSLAIAYEHYGQFYQGFGPMRDIQKCLDMYKQGAEILNNLLKDGFITTALLKWTASLEKKVARTALSLGGFENANEAILYYRHALYNYDLCANPFPSEDVTREKSRVHTCIGNIFKKYGGERNLRNALIEYKDAFFYSFHLYTGESCDLNTNRAKDCLRDMYWIYKDLGETDYQTVKSDIFSAPIFQKHDYTIFSMELEKLWNGRRENPFDF